MYHFRELTAISLQHPPEAARLEVGIPRRVLTDIFNNLFQNALDALQNQPERSISVSIEPPAGSHIFLTICDNGPGIPENLRERIFEDGFSTKSSTGLGLYHVRKFLKQFGGCIELAESGPGKGACFRIRLRIVEGMYPGTVQRKHLKSR
jgi:signal transduction histidine kinase